MSLALLFGLSVLLVLAADCIAFTHIRKHQGLEHFSGEYSLGHDLWDTMPILILAHMVVLTVAYFSLYRLLDHKLFVPLLSLSVRLFSEGDSRLAIVHSEDPIPDEIRPLFEAYNKFARNASIAADLYDSGMPQTNVNTAPSAPSAETREEDAC